MGTKVVEPELEQSPQPAFRPRLSRWSQPSFRPLAVGAAALVALGAAGIWYYYQGRESTDDAQVNGHITPISPKVYGTVAQVLVDDNDLVHAGEVLVKIDPRDSQARVSQAEAALAVAQAQEQAATIGVPLAEATTNSAILAARAEVDAAQAALDRAQLAYQNDSTAGLGYAQAEASKRQALDARAQADLARMKPLVAKAEISRQQYDSYVAAADSASSDLKAYQQKVAQAERQVQIDQAAVTAEQAQVAMAKAHLADAQANSRQVPMRTAEAHSAGAGVLQARANVEAARLDLSYTTIVAPTDGVVTNKAVEPGQIVQPGQALFALIPLNDTWVIANFKETQLARVHPGQRAQVRVDMYGKSFPGYVDSIAGATGSMLSLLPPENATGNYVKVVQRIPVKIVLDPIPSGKAILRPGMNVEATIFVR
ncbi:MAG TPA: HlyD family secretion protein [Candidatus Acidoferrales bacterium]|nr:HlyD family secretion protein [Candidatus Acidoferrales bacterium]